MIIKRTPSSIQTDTWVWGKEQIIWGWDPSHKFTFKILEPKRGKEGCLSLQYHNEKSESWLVIRGSVWVLLILNNTVCTANLHPNEGINLPTGIVHRLMGLTDDAQVLEPSTPDRHAADKSTPKDVVRLHCVHGREVAQGRNAKEKENIDLATRYTEEAIKFVTEGKMPPEYNKSMILKEIGFKVNDCR